MLNDRGGLPDLVIFVATLALLSIGIVMVFSASSVTAYHELGDPPYYYLKRQSLWAIIGIAAMIMCMNIDYHVWERLAGLLMVLSLGALVLVLVPGGWHCRVRVSKMVGSRVHSGAAFRIRKAVIGRVPGVVSFGFPG